MGQVVYFNEEKAKREFAGFNLVDKILKVIYSLQPSQRGVGFPDGGDTEASGPASRLMSESETHLA